MLEKVASVLKVAAASIINFDEEAAMNVPSNSFTSYDHSTINAMNYSCTFNPINKIVELYEVLVQREKEKVVLLQQVLDKMK